MWYVMQVFTGQEEEVKKYCELLISSENLQECFYPLAERVHKEKGKRERVKKPLFPGYLFLVTMNIQQLNAEMRMIPKLTKILKTGEEFIPISAEEQAFIEKRENEEHIFELSRGYMAGDEVVIIKGAMKGFQGKLLRIDRHNRFGVMEVEMFGRKMPMEFGLEVLKSREEWEQMADET